MRRSSHPASTSPAVANSRRSAALARDSSIASTAGRICSSVTGGNGNPTAPPALDTSRAASQQLLSHALVHLLRIDDPMQAHPRRHGHAGDPASAAGAVGGSTVAFVPIADRLPDALINLDGLSSAWPNPPGDPFHLDLQLANLACVAADHLRVGARRLVLAGVLEDSVTRARYGQTVGVPLGVARLRRPGTGSHPPA